MNYLSRQILFREIPDEVSLSYLVTGCQLKCRGCHSADSWDPLRGFALDQKTIEADLQKYEKFVTCVLFLGGEWEPKSLMSCLDTVMRKGLKTALYTGEEEVSMEIQSRLNFLKTGRYIQELGGLESPLTNQKFFELKDGQLIQRTIYKEVSL